MARSKPAPSSRLDLIARDYERRLWLQRSFGGDVPLQVPSHDAEAYSEGFARLALRPVGNTGSGLAGRAFFAAHVQAILAEEPSPAEFSIGFIKVRGNVATSALKSMAHIIRAELAVEDHLAEVREAVFGVVSPATSGLILEERLDNAALALASATFFDPALGMSVGYEVDVAMGRLDGRRTVEDVFAEARSLRTLSRTLDGVIARSHV